MNWPSPKKHVITDNGANNRLKDKAFVRGYNTAIEDCKKAWYARLMKQAKEDGLL